MSGEKMNFGLPTNEKAKAEGQILSAEDQKEFDNLGKETYPSIDEMIAETGTQKYRESLGLTSAPDSEAINEANKEFDELKPKTSDEILNDLDKQLGELKN